MAKYRGAGTIRWKASDGRSPYIGANGNWWQWNSTVNDFVDTGVKAAGVQGMPGKIPFQKEWRVGDTHRNNTNIVDYIYVRAALSADRKWYKLNDNYVTRTVPTGETEPSAATISTYYEEIPWLSALAVNVLIAEEANLANFIFKDGKLISVRGTVDGGFVDYAGQENFTPNMIIDGLTGQIIVKVNAVGGSVWEGILSPNGLFFEVSYIDGTYSPKTINIYASGGIEITDQSGSGPEENEALNIDSSHMYVQKGSIQTVISPDSIKRNNKDIILYSNIRTIGATSTLLDSDEVIVVVGTSGITLTMPTATLGRKLKIKNRASATITLTSGQQFFASGSTSVINMASGNAVELIYDGTYWCVM